jgi:hypothetical protein
LSIQALRLEMFKEAAAEAQKLQAPLNRETQGAMTQARVTALEANHHPVLALN